MKKMFSLLLCVAMLVSVFSATAFAAEAPLFSIAVDKTAVTTGDNVVVTVSHKEQDISSLAAYLKFDPAVLKLVSICDGYGEPSTSEDVDFGMWYTAKKYMGVDVGAGAAGETVYFNGTLSGETKTVSGNDKYAVITFEVIANASTTSTVEMYEGWDINTTGVIQPADTLADSETITVTVEEQKDETIAVGTKGDAADNKVTWANCSVGADLVAAGKVKAVLTNTAAEEGNQTQEVALSFGEGISGGMTCVFDVIVKFQDYAKYAATTSLAIVKAN